MGVEERASGFLEIPMRFKYCLSSKEGTDGVLRTQSNMYQFLVEDIRGRDRKDHVWAGIWGRGQSLEQPWWQRPQFPWEQGFREQPAFTRLHTVLQVSFKANPASPRGHPESGPMRSPLGWVFLPACLSHCTLAPSVLWGRAQDDAQQHLIIRFFFAKDLENVSSLFCRLMKCYSCSLCPYILHLTERHVKCSSFLAFALITILI